MSTWQFFIENGQGCYIPAYQRPYSWDSDNAARLFEDATNGIEQLLTRPSTISFLGTIIAVHDTHHATIKPLLKAEVPQKVMTIIDGQQRICTMMMINIAYHDQIRRVAKIIDGKVEEPFKWIAEQSVLRIADLEKAIVLDMNAGEENCRFYPRVIRAMDDQWSRRKAHAVYASPVARLINEYIFHFKANRTAWARYEDEQPDGRRREAVREARTDWGRVARQFYNAVANEN